MRKNSIRLLVAGALALTGVVFAQQSTPDSGPAEQAPAPPAAAPQTPAAQTPAPAAAPAKSPFTQGGIDFSFMFDGYVDANFNHPDSGFNQLHNFDMRADTAHVNMGMITMDRAPAPIGFHMDVGFGQTFDVIHAGNRDPEAFKYFKQAYVSFKPKSWHGIEVDAGEFVTAAGAEVIETNQNWNYSRSLLFAWAIPYYHFGVRASFPIGPHFTGGVQLVQGWNNIYPVNSGKTVGLNGAYAWKKVTWTNVYYGGPEKVGTDKGVRHLFDTTVLVNANDNLSYYINFDYGRDKNIGPGAQQWAGIAGAARYAFMKKYAVAGRLEWFDDMDGFSTGTAQQVKEFTLTGEYKMNSWLMSRLEFRDDWSNQSFFQKNHTTSKNQPTVLLGLVAFLGPKK
ncbi:MAG: porin [Acidobacteriia bacterium]|nr:porin [Terriglobia bacterium]